MISKKQLFLIPACYVTGCSPLALPLGELSPQVTERAALSVLAALGHLSRRERQGMPARYCGPGFCGFYREALRAIKCRR